MKRREMTHGTCRDSLGFEISWRNKTHCEDMWHDTLQPDASWREHERRINGLWSCQQKPVWLKISLFSCFLTKCRFTSVSSEICSLFQPDYIWQARFFKVKICFDLNPIMHKLKATTSTTLSLSFLHGLIMALGRYVVTSTQEKNKLELDLWSYHAVSLPSLVSASDGTVCLEDAAQSAMPADGEKNHMRGGRFQITAWNQRWGFSTETEVSLSNRDCLRGHFRYTYFWGNLF